MKENKLTIRINKPISEVFDFTITPTNTPKWIDSIVREEVNGDIKIGAQYTNESKDGQVNMYLVEDLKENTIFQLRQVTSTYHVRYTYKPLSPSETELEYFEWVDNGMLAEPFIQDTLEKLKNELEHN